MGAQAVVSESQPLQPPYLRTVYKPGFDILSFATAAKPRHAVHHFSKWTFYSRSRSLLCSDRWRKQLHYTSVIGNLKSPSSQVSKYVKIIFESSTARGNIVEIQPIQLPRTAKRQQLHENMGLRITER